MARPFDPAALRRLNAPLRAGRGLTQPTSARLSYQPGLDGLRSVALVLIVVHHLHLLGVGPDWFAGGMVGIELAFVVAGFVTTAQLLEEWERDGRIATLDVLVRRVRRLVPTLVALVVAVGAAAALWRSAALARLRSDGLPALLAVTNWREVFDDVPFFAPLDAPPLLRHLWPFAVETQWYLVWPVVLVGLLRWARGEVTQARLVVFALALASAFAGPLVYREFDAFRVDLAYLATFTRVGGLLLGAALATLWTPWRWHGAGRRALPLLDVAGFLAVLGLVGLTIRLDGTEPAAFELRALGVAGPTVLPGGLFGAAILSTVAVAAAVHPGALGISRVLGSRPMAECGRRAVTAYLWHWPIFVLFRVEDTPVRLVAAVAATATVTEVSFRFVQQPIRAGALGAWMSTWRGSSGTVRRDYTISSVLYGLAALCIVGAVVIRVADTTDVNLSVDRSTAEFDATAVLRPVSPPANTLASAPSTTAPTLPRGLLVVGDSQARSLVVNRPSGVEGTFTITDAAIPDCGVFDSGSLVTAREGYRHHFGQCEGWVREWSDAARDAKPAVTLVVLGAWDVFDIDDGDTTLAFASPEFDQRFLAKLDLGVEALKGAGSKVALLEVPCFRPLDVPAAGATALPERAADDRVAHLNTLLRQAAADDPAFVTFVSGAPQWCGDPVIGSDRAYRWNGVDFYKPGAKLQYEAIAATVVRIPV